MTTGAYGDFQRPYHYRRLSPDREDAVRRARAAGASCRDLAQVYGVCIRTVYRTLARQARDRCDIRFGDYVATFEMTNEGPAQLGPWRPL